MAKGINKVMLLGHLGKDPESRSTAGGTLVVSFSLATADRRKEGDDWVDYAEWHNIVAFGRTAEVIRDYCKKGSQVHVEGKIQTRSWDDKESGQKRYRTEILVNEITLLGSPGGGNRPEDTHYDSVAKSQARNAQRQSQTYSQRDHGSDDYANPDITDDDIPF